MSPRYHTGQWRIKPAPNEPQTCLQCRHRKVRCDKRPGKCRNCERLNLDCNPKDLRDQEILRTPSTKDAGQGTCNTQSASTRRLRGARACSACRTKKIKCTGEFPTCATCQERGRRCTYPALKRYACSNSNSSNDAGGDVTSCMITPLGDSEETHDITMDQTAEVFDSYTDHCNPVADHVVGSSATDDEATRTALNIDTNSSDGPHTASPDQELAQGGAAFAQNTGSNHLEALVDVFFESVYPMPSYAFLHPETTRRRCRNRHTHRALSSAVSAIAALYLRVTGGSATGQSPTGLSVSAEQAASWVQMTEQSIWMSLESPSVPRLQALLLVIHYHMETGRFQRAFMLTATAARFAAALRLNHERHDLPAVSREVRRRILWSLKIVERYFSVGLPEFDLLPLEVIYIDYPHREEEFAETGRNASHTSDDKGAYRLIIQLEAVRRDIMKLSRNISILETPLSSLAELIDHHRQAIAAVGAPPALHNSDLAATPDGLFLDRWLPRLLLAHVSWHQAHCDLFRILLPGYSEAAPSTVLQGYDQEELAQAEKQCLHHATRMIHLLTALNQYSMRHHLLEFDTAICAYHATRLLLFISRFGRGSDRPSPEYAASRAELCLAALKRFFLSSALVGPIIRELGQSIAVFSEQQRQSHQVSAHAASKPASVGTRSTDASPATDAGASVLRNEEQGSGCSVTESRSAALRGAEGTQLTGAARTRQRLAIHSLLRRADFPDNENDEDSDENRISDKQQHELYQVQNLEATNGLASDSPMAEPQARGLAHRNGETTWQEGIAELAVTQTKQQRTTGSHIPLPTPNSGRELGQTHASNGLGPSQQDADTRPPDLTPGNLGPTTPSIWGSSSSPANEQIQEHRDMASLDGLLGRENGTQSMFSWWGPHDWGWLFDPAGNPL